MDSVLAAPACDLVEGRTWDRRAAEKTESKREKEFYRYYGPFRQMTNYGPKYCNVHDPEVRAQHKPISCPDKILTAFCQLGALRMKARRCLIFFFDVSHAYVMAEATRTLSLEDDSVHDVGDQLWMGHSAIPRDVACCEVTINLPGFPATVSAEDDYNKSIFVVDDLTKHPHLSARSYVTGWPNGRFYAGVPITTPTGVNIGAYCILDDEPRDGISRLDTLFLRDMSSTIMTHLETVRAISERQSSTRMVDGLGKFVRHATASSSDEEVPAATNMPMQNQIGASRDVESVVPDALIDVEATPLPESPRSSRNEYFDGPTVDRQNQGGFAVPAVTPSYAAAGEEASGPGQPNSKSGSESTVPAQDDDSKSTASLQKARMTQSPNEAEDLADIAGRAFQRGAEILCHSLRIDGVVFLDAAVGTHGGLSRDAESTGTSTGDSEDSMAALSQPGSGNDEPQPKRRRTCKVLGCAQTVRKAAGEPRSPAKKLTETFLRNIMHRNPHGKIWSFDETGKEHSEDAFSSDEESPAAEVVPSSPSAQQRKASRRVRRSDGENLQLIFPGARCVALHGIYDYKRHRWSVGGLYWTYDPLRMLSVESEMHFVAAFCDIIVAETSRLEVLGSDKAKSDFISSISHELRSPLHGILGSTEILAEQHYDNTTMTLIEQIDSCGRTLLEVIDHLLDFANLKHQRLKRGTVKSSKIGRKFLPTQEGASADNDLAAVKLHVALDQLTEEAIVSSVYSYHYNEGAERRAHTSVILDIDRNVEQGWRCQLATGGWKRVCMNLVLNALKYTPFGYVRVSLKQKARPGPRKRFDAILTVTDSGIGMSKEFQKNHLFRDFAQEDTLSSGLGLGMFMVSRMVRAMDGKIGVTSDQKGKGTRVTVSVPLENRQSGPERQKSATEDEAAAARVLGDVTVGLITKVRAPPKSRQEVLLATAASMAAASVESNCKHLGAVSEHCNLDDSKRYDVKIVMEPDLEACINLVRSTRTSFERGDIAPMVVVCNNSPTAQTHRDLWRSNELSNDVVAEFISLPCGTKQIARAIKSALTLQKELMDTLNDGSQTAATAQAPEGATKDAVLQNANHQNRPGEHPTALPVKQSKDCWTRPSIDSSTLVSTQDKSGSEDPPTSSDGKEGSSPAVPSADLPSLPLEEQQAHPHVLRWPSATTMLTYPLRSRAATLQDSATIQSPESQISSQAEAPEPRPELDAGLEAAKGPSLLLVDDNSVNLRLLTTFATKRKYPFISAVDGQLAVDAFENAHKNPDASKGVPNIILMDINMPVGMNMARNMSHTLIRNFANSFHKSIKQRIAHLLTLYTQMDGYEAVQRIRRYEKKNHMPASKIIAVTALQSEAAHAEAFGSGFDIFLSKPIKLKDLHRLIEDG